MISRYQSKFMADLLSDAAKYQCWFSIEIAHLQANLRFHGKSDKALIERLNNAYQSTDWHYVSSRVQDLESTLKHDVIAFLAVLEELLGSDARMLHRGLTSSDIVDTAFALQLKKAGQALEQGLVKLIEILWQQALQTKSYYCLGRTHGQAADLTTLGIKLLGFVCEFMRGLERMREATHSIAVGKLSGAVGTYTHSAPEVEEAALKSLGLRAETVATQVIARDRHAHFFTTIALIGGSIERLATEIRLLMHGEVEELSEPFSPGQKGSSAMPHKKNPILSENLCGLARLMRSYALASLENQALWHERDISHSSVERVIGPDACHLLDFALGRLSSLIKDMKIDKKRMHENFMREKEKLSSQRVLLALVDKGLMRQKAYELVQSASFLPGSFGENLRAVGINAFLSEEELTLVLNDSLMVKHESLLFERVLKEKERLIDPKIEA